MNHRARARLAGALLLVFVFAAGALAGIAWTRRRTEGVRVNVRLNSAVPTEFSKLDLAASQEDSLRKILGAGQQRTLSLLQDFGPRLRAITDSVDASMQAVLSADQRARLLASRRSRPASVDSRVVDTVSRAKRR